MSGEVQGRGGLVEPEGVNAGGPVDGGRPPAEPDEHQIAAGHEPGEREAPVDRLGQGAGELLSGPGSDNGVTHGGPGQEMSAGEG